MNLQHLVSKYINPLSTAGTLKQKLDRQLLRDDLRKLAGQDRNFFLVLFLFCVLLLGAQIWLLLHMQNQPDLVRRLLGATPGVAASGTLAYAVRLMREHSRTMLLWTLVPHLSEPDLHLVLESILYENRREIDTLRTQSNK